MLNGQEIIPLDTLAGKNLTTTVFGYFPQWEYQKARESIQYDLLSHIALFPFKLQQDGSLSTPDFWPWADVINEAHAHGVRVIITVDNDSSEEFYQFLLDSHARKTFYQHIESLVIEYKLDGVNVNFEHLPIPSRNTMLNDFLLEMHDLLTIITPWAEVSFTGPAIDAGGWDFTGLAASCDYIFIMGYDFKGGWSDETGPSAPLTGGFYNLTRTLEKEYDDVVANTPEKLILGFPYYGNKWESASLEPYSPVVDHVNAYRYRDLIDEGLYHGLLWDSISQTPWYRYTENEKYYQVWFETRESLSLKYDLIDKHQIKGLGIWALGYDRDHAELWDEIRERYFDTSSRSGMKGNETLKLNCYPNPSSEWLHISIHTPSLAPIHLTIYSASGNLIENKTIDSSLPGDYHLNYSIEHLPDGIYIIQALSKDRSVYVKMVKN